MAPKAVHPVLVANVAYRRAIVRLCVEQIREIEGRLEQGCGVRFEQQLQGCDDLAGVARALAVLQRRTQLHAADSGWLDELAVLPAAELDERAIEMTRHLKRRLAELDRAVPYATDPSQYIGAAVLRRLEGHGALAGTVVEHDALTGFRVQYADGDAEDVTLRELLAILPRDRAAPPPPASSCAAVAAAADPAMLRDLSVQQLFCRLERRRREEQAERLVAEEAALEAAAAAEAPAQKGLSARGEAGGGCAGRAAAVAAREEQNEAPCGGSGGGGGAKGGAPRNGKKGGAGAERRLPPKAGAEVNGHALAAAEPPKRALVPCGAEKAAEPPKRGAEEVVALAELPEGWRVAYASNGKAEFISPDGITTFSTVSKAQKWHRMQLAAVAQLSNASKAKRRRAEKGISAPPTEPTEEPSLAEEKAPPHDAAEPAPAALGDAAPAFTREETPQVHALPAYGLGLIELEAVLEKNDKKTRIPRELRGLAVPDREWKVALPYFTQDSKTREQFISHLDSRR
ncbi:hypothetical protein AB1Y20_009672 [Prymnesium parvum]|uniref:PTM/DIR17-like Tudor domain-containing protein n=1 Tax=Prymnesium parvum TaxID=97485 RepID=A0AB34K574_PRYPA